MNGVNKHLVTFQCIAYVLFENVKMQVLEIKIFSVVTRIQRVDLLFLMVYIFTCME